MTHEEYCKLYERYGYNGANQVAGFRNLPDTLCPRCGQVLIPVGARTCYDCYAEVLDTVIIKREQLME